MTPRMQKKKKKKTYIRERHGSYGWVRYALGGENATSTGRVLTLQASKPLAERLTAAIWAAAFVGRTDDV